MHDVLEIVKSVSTGLAFVFGAMAFASFTLYAATLDTPHEKNMFRLMASAWIALIVFVVIAAAIR